MWLLSLQISGKNATKYQNNTSNGAQNATGKDHCNPQCSISNEDIWEIATLIFCYFARHDSEH